MISFGLLTQKITFGHSQASLRSSQTAENLISLKFAVLLCRADQVRDALLRGEDPNALDDRGQSFLKVLLADEVCDRENDKKAIIQLFLDFGADPNAIIIPELEETLLMVAADKRDNIEIIKIILQAGGYRTIDATNIQGNTALMLAVLNERIETICFLLSRGARIDISNKWGWTAIGYALVHKTQKSKAILHAMSRYNPENPPEVIFENCIDLFP